MAHPDLQIRGWRGKGGGWSSRPWDKGGPASKNIFFRSFGPHFDRKIRGTRPSPPPQDPSPGSATDINHQFLALKTFLWNTTLRYDWCYAASDVKLKSRWYRIYSISWVLHNQAPRLNRPLVGPNWNCSLWTHELTICTLCSLWTLYAISIVFMIQQEHLQS